MYSEKQKTVTTLQALEMTKNYCAAGEHCQFDVRRKLAAWKIDEEKAEWIIGELITEGYINEERFARAFARGKFNIKSWGKQKIVTELKKRNISDYCIRQALSEIKEENYTKRLTTLAEKWLDKHKNEPVLAKKQKLFRYLVSKGYQMNEIWNFINKNS